MAVQGSAVLSRNSVEYGLSSQSPKRVFQLLKPRKVDVGNYIGKLAMYTKAMQREI